MAKFPSTDREALQSLTAFIQANSDATGSDIAAAAVAVLSASATRRREAAVAEMESVG